MVASILKFPDRSAMSQLFGFFGEIARSVARAIAHWLQSDGDDDLDSHC